MGMETDWGNVESYAGAYAEPAKWLVGHFDGDGTAQTTRKFLAFFQSSKPFLTSVVLPMCQLATLDLVWETSHWEISQVTSCHGRGEREGFFSGGSPTYQLQLKGAAAQRVASEMKPFIQRKLGPVCCVAREAPPLADAEFSDAYTGGLADAEGCVQFTHHERILNDGAGPRRVYTYLHSIGRKSNL